MKPTVKPADPKRVVCYIRLSPAGSRDIADALGPDAQRESMQRWCEDAGAEMIGVFEDLDVSGGADIDKRPGLCAALDALRTRDAGVLLVAKRDRLARHVVNAALIESLAARVGARVVSAAGEGTDGEAGDPAQELMRVMIDAFAQYERALIRARTRSALRVKQERGEWCGRPRVGTMPDPENPKRTIPNERELEAARIAHALHRQDMSFRAIGAELTARGYEPRKGGWWHAVQVKRLVQVGALT